MHPRFPNKRITTGIPLCSTNGAVTLSEGRISKRRVYPERALNLNEANVLEAIDR